MSEPPTGALEAPAVDADVYDADYYLQCCAGHEDWVASGGQRADALYAGSLERAGLRPGDVVVDIGTGRGELLAVALDRGAGAAIGVEYSHAALGLAATTLRAAGAGARAWLVAADCRALPLPDHSADLVTMLDVVEHLTPAELAAAFTEARRVLRPGGRLFAHTMPTRTVYEVTYRLQRLAVPGRRRRWPADPRQEVERQMHVNEQTRRGLRRALERAGFATVAVDYGEWVHDGFVPDPRARRLYRRLAAHRLTVAFGVCDLWARATAPGRPQERPTSGGARSDGPLPGHGG